MLQVPVFMDFVGIINYKFMYSKKKLFPKACMQANPPKFFLNPLKLQINESTVIYLYNPQGEVNWLDWNFSKGMTFSFQVQVLNIEFFRKTKARLILKIRDYTCGASYMISTDLLKVSLQMLACQGSPFSKSWISTLPLLQ